MSQAPNATLQGTNLFTNVKDATVDTVFMAKSQNTKYRSSYKESFKT